MKKRFGAIFLSVLLCIPAVTVFAEDLPDRTALETAAPVDTSLPAKSAVLMEQESGRVLFEKNADEKLPPASITKVMTLLLVMEALDAGKFTIDDLVSCSEHAESMGGSQIWFKAGEQLSVDDLLKATAISSANDASVALAELVAGSEERFVGMMNERAEQLGMNHTHFVNATGLDAEGHFSSARDIATMSRELLKHKQIINYSSVWMGELRDGKTQLVNTNKLVRFYDGCTGLKTGTTNGAGSCLSASATKKGMSLVAVTLGSATGAERFSAARGLLDYGFANYARVELPPVEGIGSLPVCRGIMPSVDVISETPGTVVVRVSDKEQIKQEPSLPESVEAPVETGQLLGKVTVRVGENVLCEYSLIAAESVARMSIGKAFLSLFRSLIKL